MLDSAASDPPGPWPRWGLCGSLLALVLVGLLAPSPVAGEVEPPTADIGKVFGSWPEWESAYVELVAALDAFEELGSEAIGSPGQLVVAVQARDRVYRIARDVEGYLYLRLQLNGADEEARSRQALVDETDRRWWAMGSPWFDRSVSRLGRETVERWVAEEAALGSYAHFFRSFFDLAEHPYPEGQGELRRLSSLFAQQSRRVYNALAVTEAPVVEVTLQSGERVEIDPGRARTLSGELPLALDRQAVSRAWRRALGQRSQTYAALLEGVIRRQKVVAGVRQFDSALSAQLHGDAISAPAVRDAIRTARLGSEPLRRYHSLRRRALGIDEYSLADCLIPLEAEGREIGFGEARRLIIRSAATLGPTVQDAVERAFSEGWIDAVERPGKRAHGGSTFVAGHPYVLVQYRGSLESVFQLAHEIGHAVHALLAHEAQPFVYSHRSSLTSEAVASLFEEVLVDEMRGSEPSPADGVRILDLAIQNLLRRFYRPLLDADFELRLYETEQPITGPALGELYLAVVREFYGDSVDLNDWDRHAWQQIPHLYTSPLYLGRYGLAAGASSPLLSRLTHPSAGERAAARSAVLELMRSGASAYPAELLRRAGVDLDARGTTEALVGRLESLVTELERALEGR